MSSVRTSLLVSLLAAAISCAQKYDHPSEGKPTTTAAPLADSVASAVPEAAPVPVASVAARPTQKVELQIGAVASTMTFDKSQLTVPAGAEVHLVLKDALPGQLLHNWVLVRPGTEAAVAAAGLPAGQAGNYLTPGPDVLAFTPLAKPGATAEVTFQAPPPGNYPYICSFPGHYIMMKGTLVVTP